MRRAYLGLPPTFMSAANVAQAAKVLGCGAKAYACGVLLVLAVGLSGCGIFLSVQQLIEAYMGQG
jgi:hypothetical protein